MCQYDVNVPFHFHRIFTEQFDHSIIYCMKKTNEPLTRQMYLLERDACKTDAFIETKR